jgi:hypothetical protein
MATRPGEVPLPTDVYRELDTRVSEVKRMLYRFIQSLADA